MNIDSLDGLAVLDGAMATELERRGADLDHPLWSARVLDGEPGLIGDVHYDYFAAGADIGISATYQATFAGFERHGIDARRGRALLRLGVELACAARDRFWQELPGQNGRRWPLVAASVGPYGAHLHDGSEYTGAYDVDTTALMDFHRRQVEVLAGTDADLIAFETIPSLHEAEAILRLLEEFPGVCAWISFSCRSDGESSRGEPFADCVALASASPQVVATGLNCTAPRHVASLLALAAPVTRKPLLAYPNSGETWLADGNRWCGGGGAGDMGELARVWRAAGATLVGGCCRTTPEDIRSIAMALGTH